MAGRPKRRARLAREGRSSSRPARSGSSGGTSRRYERLKAILGREPHVMNPDGSRRSRSSVGASESASGCSTRGYDPTALLRREGASERDISEHIRTMPAFIREEGVHNTGRGSDILTFCRGGRLQTMVQDD